MVNCLVKNGTFSHTQYDVHICVLLKKDRDETNIESYWPVSLLNSDQKIIAKALTNQLNKYIGTLIHPDQSGIIPDRYSFSNTRCLLNMMYLTKLPHTAAVSLDTQQAFDQGQWKYMFAALKKISFGLKFMKILNMVYACPQSSVITNH